ncbi:MAG TPA: FtsW/RodA/SpoVE family cell cycle protein [Elainellaceae cyanobacterium]
MNFRHLIPVFDPSVKEWAFEARLLRWLTFLWLLIGLVTLFSASYVVADQDVGDGLHYFKTQILWICLGLVGFNILVHSPLRYFLSITDWLYLLVLGLVLATLIPGLGTTVSGATRWLAIGSVGIQPSELIKPLLVLQSARIFGGWHRLTKTTRASWLGIFLVTLVCILLQPNLSTAALCGFVIWLMALSSGLPYHYLMGTALGGLFLATISISLQDYQRRRLISFLDPWANASQDSYQLVQSLIAIGSGGVWGSGFGLSHQKLFYLPIQYTDFIFAVFAEEFGLIGSLLLLALLAAYATLGLRVSIKCNHPVHQLIAIGAVVLLVGQALLNIGVATGALPTTGLPFPMLSYGGSSMISSLLAAGLLIRVARESSGAEVIPFKLAS